MVNNSPKTYAVVGFLRHRIRYRRFDDVVCDGVGNIVGQSGNNGVKTYDIVCFFYDVVGLTYDVVGYYTILYTTAYTIS